ncbi:MAG: diguanylate cyclase, partial [Acidobacteriota bacterium]
MDYSALRESGMELIRKWASESWTDHNVHDPGITILEACSYAMTELGLRLQLNVADLLRSGESNGTADLEPAHRVLPAGPVTPADLRSVLLDHPSIRDAQIMLPADS